jgi:hypothetical protein
METVEEEQPLRRATGCHHGRQPFFSPLASEPWNQDPGPARDGVFDCVESFIYGVQPRLSVVKGGPESTHNQPRKLTDVFYVSMSEETDIER